MIYNAHLDTFLIVANTGSFSRAAAQLYVTPSAVIQQINSLEAELKVKLFHRSNKGVTLTKQGMYLKGECVAYIKTGRAIEEKLLAMPDSESSLILGTSLAQKCRIFYDYWVLFSKANANCTVQLQTIDTHFPIPQEVDFIEATYANAPWQSCWDFLALCRVPFGIAAAKDHPLYEKDSLTYDDLKPYVVVLQPPQEGMDALPRLRRELAERGIQVIERSGFEGSVVWEASINRQLIVLPMCFQDVVFDMRLKPMDWSYAIPYGFFYRPDISGLAKGFLDFVTSNRLLHPEIAGRLARG